MKRSDSPDYFCDLTSGFSRPKDERNPNSGYSNEFQAMLDRLEEEEEEECIEESNLTATEKKRRLSSHQVQALEKNFEVENKLDPQRKATLAQKLGLQPRQVAVWFQNRRARWKTKQLERNYAVLKADYDSLRVDFDALERQKEALDAEIKELKEKLQGGSTESDCSVQKQSPLLSETEINDALERSRICEYEFTGLNIDHCNETKVLGFNRMEDGPSESDSSGHLKEECKTSNAQLLISPAASSSSSSSQMVPHWPMMDCRAISESGFQAQFVGMEEQGFYGTTEGSCNFFSVDQAPTLLWYYSNQ